MHELSIAYSIIDIVNEEAQKANSSKVSEIELEVGSLSGVEVDALEFAMEAAKKDTIIEAAEIKILLKPAIAKCKKCTTEFSATSLFDPCPQCGGFENEIIQGQEMRVKSLVVE